MFFCSFFYAQSYSNEVYNHCHDKVALDESYMDLANLVNKIQKHSSFESELSANKPRLSAVREEGEALCAQSHFASSEIVSQLEDLQVRRSRWEMNDFLMCNITLILTLRHAD